MVQTRRKSVEMVRPYIQGTLFQGNVLWRPWISEWWEWVVAMCAGKGSAKRGCVCTDVVDENGRAGTGREYGIFRGTQLEEKFLDSV